MDQNKLEINVGLTKAGKADREDLEAVIALLPLREKALAEACIGLKKVNPKLNAEEVFALGATDLFVEKAQLVLTRRSRILFISGVGTIFMTIVILGLAIWFIGGQLGIPLDERTINSTRALAFRMFQATALSAFLLVGVKLLISLSRSFFHEAISLLERRHALRFGRLFVYLTKGSVADERLEEAFQWNKESRTSFLDMKPEVLAETLLHKAIEALGKLPPETVKAIATARKSKRPLAASDGK